jgi:hypothetical protein
MLLTITPTRRPANDLGNLLHKHPEYGSPTQMGVFQRNRVE